MSTQPASKWEYSDEFFLKHYGIKGMRWGVRRSEAELSRARGGKRKSKKALRKADRKWAKEAQKRGTTRKVSKTARENAKPVMKAINNRPEYKDLNLRKDPTSPLARRYLADQGRVMVREYNNASMEIVGVSPSGKKKITWTHSTVDPDGNPDNSYYGRITRVKTARHSDDDDVVALCTLGPDGKFADVEFIFESLSQSEDDWDEFLAHYGIKGMKWGVRRSDEELGRARAKRKLTDKQKQNLALAGAGVVATGAVAGAGVLAANGQFPAAFKTFSAGISVASREVGKRRERAGVAAARAIRGSTLWEQPRPGFIDLRNDNDRGSLI